MRKQHASTLQALFSHPLRHDLGIADVEALLLQLGFNVEQHCDHLLNLQTPSGAELMLHTASGHHHLFPNGDSVLRLRRFLRQQRITPEHLIAD